MREKIVAFGGGLALAVVASVSMLVLVGTSSNSPGAPQNAVADVYECASGDTVQSSYSHEANAFRVVGQIVAIDGGEFQVKVPGSDVTVTLAFDSRVDGRYGEGDLVQVGGRISVDGELQATDVRGGCSGSGNFVQQPTARPDDIAQNLTPVPTPAPGATDAPDDDDGNEEFVQVITGQDGAPILVVPPQADDSHTPTPTPKKTATPTPRPTVKKTPSPTPTVLSETPTPSGSIEPTPTPTPSVPTPRPVAVVAPLGDEDDPREPAATP